MLFRSLGQLKLCMRIKEVKMTYRVERITKQTFDATGAGTVTTGKIHGKILSIKFVVNVSATFQVATTQSPIAEVIFGTSAVTVSTTAVYNPRVIGNLNTTGAALGASNQANAYCEMCIDAPLLFSAVGTEAKTWSAEIMYED